MQTIELIIVLLFTLQDRYLSLYFGLELLKPNE